MLNYKVLITVANPVTDLELLPAMPEKGHNLHSSICVLHSRDIRRKTGKY